MYQKINTVRIHVQSIFHALSCTCRSHCTESCTCAEGRENKKQWRALLGVSHIYNLPTPLVCSSFPYPLTPALRYGRTLDPNKNVIVTSSGTEAIFASVQALCDPGDEVVIFEPFFPWYLPCIRLAGTGKG